MAPNYAERWDALGRGETIPTPDVSNALKPKQHYSPLAQAADDFVHWAQNPSERIYLGFQDIDEEMRGIAPSEMCLINGYSHSGKTMFLLQILLSNRDKSVVYFCPDEPRTLTLIKLTCLMHGIPADVLERQVANNDHDAISLLRQTAEDSFPHLAVFDQMMTLNEMEHALGEIRDMWGQPSLLVFDYLELLNGGGEDVPSKANTLKAFGKRHNIPLLVLHQSSRTAGADGKKMTISSGAYGGEQQATHILGVRRKKFDIEAQIRDIEERLDTSKNTERLLERLDTLRYDLRIHQNTVTVNLVKCKRPASRLIDDIDFEIEQGTGRLTRLPTGHFPSNVTTVADTFAGEQLSIIDDDWI
jgi:KaiC/GvpD/RAD55 family RecA-like ATPase